MSTNPRPIGNLPQMAQANPTIAPICQELTNLIKQFNAHCDALTHQAGLDLRLVKHMDTGHYEVYLRPKVIENGLLPTSESGLPEVPNGLRFLAQFPQKVGDWKPEPAAQPHIQTCTGTNPVHSGH